MLEDMIIRIILNNFFKKYYMNKKIVHLLTHKLPIVTVIILILSYVYLSIPENYTLQVGGVPIATTIPLPSNTPWKYKYRWLLVGIPILLLANIIFSALKVSNVSKLTVWDLGKDFFYQFQKQVGNAVTTGAVESGNAANFKYTKIDPTATSDPNIIKLFNMIQLSGDPKSTYYGKSQYFCNSFRPCSCCGIPEYTTFFTNMKQNCNTINSTDKTMQKIEKFANVQGKLNI